MSELKCCKRCGAFYTCTHKGECCPECEYFDPIDHICLAVDEPIPVKKPQARNQFEDVDPETFLFEDDEDDEDFETSDFEEFDDWD